MTARNNQNSNNLARLSGHPKPWGDVNAGSWWIWDVRAVTVLLRALALVRSGEERAGGLSGPSGAAAGHGKSPPKKTFVRRFNFARSHWGGGDIFAAARSLGPPDPPRALWYKSLSALADIYITSPLADIYITPPQTPRVVFDLYGTTKLTLRVAIQNCRKGIPSGKVS